MHITAMAMTQYKAILLTRSLRSAPQLYPIAGWSESNTPYMPGTMIPSMFMNTP